MTIVGWGVICVKGWVGYERTKFSSSVVEIREGQINKERYKYVI